MGEVKNSCTEGVCSGLKKLGKYIPVFAMSLVMLLSNGCRSGCTSDNIKEHDRFQEVTQKMVTEITATLDESLLDHFVAEINQFFAKHHIPQNIPANTIKTNIRYGKPDFRDPGNASLVSELYTLEALYANINLQQTVLGNKENDYENISQEEINNHRKMIDHMIQIQKDLLKKIASKYEIPIEKIKKRLKMKYEKNTTHFYTQVVKLGKSAYNKIAA